MRTDYENLRVSESSAGVITAAIDVPGKSVNFLTEQLLNELAAFAADLEDASEGSVVVLRSDKASGFLAGADLRRIRDLKTPEEADRMLRQGQQVFAQIAALPMPTLALLQGVCLGGGLELALACRYRIARDAPDVQIGFPETQLGLIPGWGGTQSLPRLVGADAAAEMILGGQPLHGEEALAMGLVDWSSPAETFEFQTQRVVRQLQAGAASSAISRPDREPALQALEILQSRLQTLGPPALSDPAPEGASNPALSAALRAMIAGVEHGLETGLAVERDEFRRVLFDPVCQGRLERFFQRRAKGR